MEDSPFLERLESMIQEMEACAAPAARERLRGVVQVLLEFHGRGLARIMEHLRRHDEAGHCVVEALVRDDLAASLLLLHDLHPQSLARRAEAVVKGAAPYWASKGAVVRFDGISDEGAVRLGVVRTKTCASSYAALKQSIEQAVYAAAPDAAGIDFAESMQPRAASAFVPLTVSAASSCHAPAPSPPSTRPA